jgi:hypothetical protein
MKIPPIVLFTAARPAGQPVDRIGVRVDMVVLIERAPVSFEEPVAPGVSTRKAKNSFVATVLHLAGGDRVPIEESVEKAQQMLDRVRNPGWFA